jgi:hypothetical protein
MDRKYARVTALHGGIGVRGRLVRTRFRDLPFWNRGGGAFRWLSDGFSRFIGPRDDTPTYFMSVYSSVVSLKRLD